MNVCSAVVKSFTEACMKKDCSLFYKVHRCERIIEMMHVYTISLQKCHFEKGLLGFCVLFGLCVEFQHSEINSATSV